MVVEPTGQLGLVQMAGNLLVGDPLESHLKQIDFLYLFFTVSANVHLSLF